ncbi:MAG: hypothetical protein NT157_01915 [Candidatus Micrarchaeota archaeon]|nr:hypothetical protein [Candidatus Micrarchaeota archaeon]
MGDEIPQICADSLDIKGVILQNKNVDILLYLAKYNPEIKEKDIIEKFGKESIRGLNALKRLDLVKEMKGYLFLTDDGIFQVDGLLTMVA